MAQDPDDRPAGAPKAAHSGGKSFKETEAAKAARGQSAPKAKKNGAKKNDAALSAALRANLARRKARDRASGSGGAGTDGKSEG